MKNHEKSQGMNHIRIGVSSQKHIIHLRNVSYVFDVDVYHMQGLNPLANHGVNGTSGTRPWKRTIRDME